MHRTALWSARAPRASAVIMAIVSAVPIGVASASLAFKFSGRDVQVDPAGQGGAPMWPARFPVGLRLTGKRPNDPGVEYGELNTLPLVFDDERSNPFGLVFQSPEGPRDSGHDGGPGVATDAMYSNKKASKMSGTWTTLPAQVLGASLARVS